MPVSTTSIRKKSNRQQGSTCETFMEIPRLENRQKLISKGGRNKRRGWKMAKNGIEEKMVSCHKFLLK